MKNCKVICSVTNVIYAVHIRLFKRIAKGSKSDVIVGYDPTEREVGNYLCGRHSHTLFVISSCIHRKETSANKLLFNPAEEGRRMTHD